MGYRHQFTGRTEGIRATAPLRWRGLDGLLGAYWQAEGERGGRGYYLSANPRISVFFEDVSSVRVGDSEGALARRGRPMARAFYVPAGAPMWTAFTAPLAFSHLDVHLDAAKLSDVLGRALGRAAAREALARPAEVHDASDIEGLARLLAAEVAEPRRHDLYAESLGISLATAVLDLGGPAAAPAPARAEGRLTRWQMRRIVERFEAGGGRRLTVAEMAATVGLSESWFSHVFRNTTGLTPLQWQSARRIELAKALLADGGLSISEVAARLGFADQAHLTRVFRRIEGETPAAWRRGRAA